MKPLEAFGSAVSYVLLSANNVPNVPGAVIEKLSTETRQALSELKSDDISSNVIPDCFIFGDNEYYRKKEFVKELMAFDSKMRK